jgi:hypothetical protein
MVKKTRHDFPLAGYFGGLVRLFGKNIEVTV